LKEKDLKHIFIDGNSKESYYPKCILDHGLTYLSNKLIKNKYPNLTSLTLMGTQIRKEGLKGLSELLLSNTSIVRITFSCN
jgi:hypothetical protein